MLKLSNCSLKDIDDSTKDLILNWRNQEYIRKMMFNQNIISKEEHYAWVASLQSNHHRIVKVFYFGESPMGIVTFSSVNNQDSIFEWGFYIGEQKAPKGMGTLLGITAIDEYFNDKEHYKLFAEVLEYNLPSISYHQKLGFKEEGILKNHHKIEGVFYNVHVFGLFKEEWNEQRKKLLERLGEHSYEY